VYYLKFTSYLSLSRFHAFKPVSLLFVLLVVTGRSLTSLRMSSSLLTDSFLYFVFFQQHVLEEMRSSVDNCNQNRAASRSIGKYDVIEVLGSGAFGTVYKVRKRAAQSFFAMKEVKLWAAVV
jgi:hypothetical protein